MGSVHRCSQGAPRRASSIGDATAPAARAGSQTQAVPCIFAVANWPGSRGPYPRAVGGAWQGAPRFYVVARARTVPCPCSHRSGVAFVPVCDVAASTAIYGGRFFSANHEDLGTPRPASHGHLRGPVPLRVPLLVGDCAAACCPCGRRLKMGCVRTPSNIQPVSIRGTWEAEQGQHATYPVPMSAPFVVRNRPAAIGPLRCIRRSPHRTLGARGAALVRSGII